jgi:hypothetical protein
LIKPNDALITPTCGVSNSSPGFGPPSFKLDSAVRNVGQLDFNLFRILMSFLFLLQGLQDFTHHSRIGVSAFRVRR